MDGPRRSDTQYWREVEEIFASVLDAEPARRESTLEDRCGGRAELRAEVEALLASHERADEFIRPRTTSKPDLDGPVVADVLIDARIGAYRVLERIGEGGMGAVYRAERVEGGFAQEVAIKVIGSRLQSVDTVRRFRAERQILATLQHPHIVALLDGGITPAGHPYLAMEYVKGLPLTEYCATNRTSLPDRIHLFLQVCAAVRFAHRHLIVHRDLKPANVMVTPEGVVKVLDFGIAKLLQEEGTPVEGTGLLLGPLTADYASPEQIRGGLISTASDIYSLGVLLYELLSGTRPYRTVGKTIDEVLRLVVHDEPPRPSTTLSPHLAYNTSELRGDLDAIVVKAMAKDPDRRYASAEDLSDDLERYGNGRPVKAQPDSRSYVIGKFLRRHRTAVAAALVATLAVVTGLGVSLWQARVARAERDRAAAQAQKALATTRFLSGIFENANPVSARGKTVTARDLLDAGVASVDSELASRPDAQAELLIVMARAYDRLGQRPRAGELAEKALALRLKTEGIEDAALAEAEHLAGRTRRTQGRYADAIEVLTDALRRYESAKGPQASEVARVMRDLAIAHSATGRRSEGITLLRSAIAIEEKAAPLSAHHALLWSNLGSFLVAEGDARGARAAFERSILLYERVQGPESWGIAMPLLSQGDALRAGEEWASARSLFERALKVDIETFGEESDSTAYTLGRLGDLALGEGKVREARVLLERSQGILDGIDAQGIMAMLTRAFMGRLLLAEGRTREALELLERVLKRYETMHPKGHPDLAIALVDVASAHRRLGDAAKAESLLTRALTVQRATLGRGHQAFVPTLTEMGELHTESRPAKARSLLEEAVEIARRELPEKHSQRVRAEAALSRLGSR